METINRTTIYLTKATAVLVIGIAVIVLWGWQIDSVAIKHILPKMVAMNPTSAAGFICCGFAFLLLHQPKHKYQHLIGNGLVFLVFVMAILKFIALTGLFDAGVEQILYQKKIKKTLYNGTYNSIAPNASIAFILTSFSIFFMGRRKITTSQWLALPVSAIGLLSVIGYTYHLSSFYNVTPFIPMSLHTGICFLLFSIALLFADSSRGFVSEFTSKYAGGKAARYILPASFIIPIALGYLVLNGMLKEHFSIAVWVSFFITVAIFLFAIISWITAYKINRFEVERLREKQIVDEKTKQLAEQEYKQSQERYYILMNSVDGIVWEADAKSFAFTFISKQAERLLGYPLERWTKEPDFWQQHIYHEDRDWAVNFCLQSTKEGKPHQFEYRMVADDGRLIWLRDIVTVIIENNIPVRLSGIMVDITEQRKLQLELQDKQLSQQKLITEISILAQEKERNELGLELHDNINQLLSVVKLYLGVAKTEKTFNEEIIERSYLHLEEAMHDIRKLSHSLVAPSLGYDGLKEALEDLVESVLEPNKLTVQLMVDEDYDALEVDKNKELMLYRIVQEQLNNIMKYAKASEITIRLQQEGENLILFIRDNGVGFDIHQQGNGIGLKNINSRVNFYSGKMHLASAPGQGCTLEVSIPN